jgi:hypothetical protein
MSSLGLFPSEHYIGTTWLRRYLAQHLALCLELLRTASDAFNALLVM